jgi:SAM-dependent methyltransferase
MTKPILDRTFWVERLRRAEGMQERHRAVYECTVDEWAAIEKRHREILSEQILPLESILDAGCGWGRLLGLMPPHWRGDYYGVDLCPEFVGLAKELHPAREFRVADLRDLGFLRGGSFDWAVLVSIRTMVVRELGKSEWQKMEAELRRVARHLLFLEYRADDPGAIE